MKEHNPEGVRPRQSSTRLVVPKLCEDFSSRSRKKNAPFEGRERVMGVGGERREFRSHPRHLFRSAHSIFRGLTALRRRRSGVVFPLFTSVCTRETQSRKGASLPSRRIFGEVANVKGAEIEAASRRIRVSSGWIAAPSVSVEIYVSEIISFSFSEIKRFILRRILLATSVAGQNLMIHSFAVRRLRVPKLSE